MTPSDETNSPGRQKQHRKLRSRFIAASLIVLFLAALILTPPYVNVNRYRRRITTTMSQSLGRPVHLDNVSLHLLPVPGLTLSNLIVSEDPSFGYEPVIRANTVEASLRVASLWRRQIEFSTIRFIDPSVNLVRNAQGRWNLEDVLMQASHVEAAPTAQRRAGPAPRFPYIEATGARVNLKIGIEKKPFSLTETQFALWLPSPQTWRVRLRGRPARTDGNVSQTGELSLEGSLQRAPKMSDVPVDIHASWNGSPLGEASRLLTGADAGWRGTGFVEAHLIGPVSRASLTTHLQLNDLRRADFVPARPLDITVDCSSLADVARGTLQNATCAIPIGDAKPVVLSVGSVDLEQPRKAEAQVAANSVPMPWAFGWAKLFVSQIPATLEPAGLINGTLSWNVAAASWQGELTAKLTQQKQVDSDTQKTPDAPSFVFAVDISPMTESGTTAAMLRLAPVVLHPAAGSVLNLSGVADANGYGLQLSGTATDAQVLGLADTLPPLNNDVARLLKVDDNKTVHAVALSCSRLWGGPQACIKTAQTPTAKPSHNKHRH